MTSYKAMWQEAEQELKRLQAEIDRLRRIVEADPSDCVHELERTRRIVDLEGVARHLRVKRFTPQQWQQRGHLPPVDFPEIRTPLWYASTIRDQFAIPTRRPWYDNPEEDLSLTA